MAKNVQNATQNNSGSLIEVKNRVPDTIGVWMVAYFRYEVTTSESSRKAQRKDLALFREFILGACGGEGRALWTPRVSQAFKEHLKQAQPAAGRSAYSDRSVNRILAHLKTFAKWVHHLRAFPLGNPMAKMKLMPVGTGLEIERALNPAERRRILDAADTLPVLGGRSKDRHRYRGKERPQRKGYRPYRNRAMVYALIETGMRRAAVRNLNVGDVDFESKTLAVEEKGGRRHAYKISSEGLSAIGDYLESERGADFAKWGSAALFLSAGATTHGNGRLNVRMVNTVWNAVCRHAGVEGHTPHDARHAMGKHIIEKTGNIAAVQRQLGHTNPAYSMQYARITDQELVDVIEDR